MPPLPSRLGPTSGLLPRQGSAYGGQPLPLPLVAAVGVNNLTATGANLIGSVNPQGLSGNWWFAYGTTPAMTSVTSTQALAATALPQTVTATLTGLVTGSTYWFAPVAQTAAGTVTGAPVQFVPANPQPVTDVTNLPTPTGTPAVSIPHAKFPISFSPSTGLGVVEQDTLDEVFSNVQSVMACQVGQCPELPLFGYHDPTFGQVPLDPSTLIADIQRWEPRATERALSEAAGDPNGGSWQIVLTTLLAGAGQ